MRRAGRISICAVALLSGGAPAAAVTAGSPTSPRPEFDVRSGEHAAVSDASRGARQSLASHLGPQSTLAADPIGGGLRTIGRTDGFVTGPSDADPADIALAYVRAHLTAFALTAADLDGLRPFARYRSPDGVVHLTWRQVVDGVPSFDSVLSANVSADGRIVNIGGAPVHAINPPDMAPRLTAAQALGVGQQDVGGSMSAPAGTTKDGPEQQTTFSNGDSARLVVLPDPAGDRLAWRLTVAGEGPYVYDELVDANTGDVLVRHDLTEFAKNATIFDYHPGAAIGGTQRTVDLAADPTWLSQSAGDTMLSGRNAHAYSDVNNNDVADASEEVPAVGGNWTFALQSVAPLSGSCPTHFPPCTWDGATAPSSSTPNRAEVTTQVFYFVNNYHDWLAQSPIGFTDASHNFEVGGTGGSDPVNAESDDGGGTNNANMSTPPDGTSPRMQMYLFNAPSAGWPDVNGGDDASVVYHEYTHGLSNRLVNNGLGGGLIPPQSRAMGEGWSDWYAMDYLVAQGFVPDTSADGEVVVGEYVTDNTVTGIRTKALDCSLGSAATGCAATASVAHPGGYTLGDMGHVAEFSADHPYFEVHADGEIWAQTLWDLRKAVGATNARALITGGLRLSPAGPSFLDMRDAIVQEANVLGGGLPAQVWQVFASRGFGYSASTAGANATRSTEAFDLPALAKATTPTPDDAAPIGNGNAVAEPGDVVRLPIAVSNPGATALTGVTGTLSTSTPGAAVTRAQAGYGTIAAGASGTPDNPFVLAVPATATCGTAVALSLALTTDQGSVTLPLTLDTGSGTVTTASTDVPKAIADGPNTFENAGPDATSTLSVPSSGPVGALQVHLTLNHTYTGDLHIRLAAPNGSSIQLAENPGLYTGSTGGSFDGFSDVVLDDTAASGIQDVAATSGTVGGPFRPDEALRKLAGVEQHGTWTLRLDDTFSNDTGSLTAWSIVTRQPACSAAPAQPIATTGAAGGVTSTTATLGGTIDPQGAATSYRVEYGTTAAYGQASPAASAGSGTGAVAQSAAVTGLAPTTTYHFRMVALRGTPDTPVAVGADATFTTAAGTAPPPTTTTPPPTNTAPTCTTQPSVAVRHATAKDIALVCADPDADVLTLSVAGAPAHGTLSAIDATTHHVTYRPAAGYAGADSFTFWANDGHANSAPATVGLVVARPPLIYGLPTRLTVTAAGRLTVSFRSSAKGRKGTLTVQIPPSGRKRAITLAANGFRVSSTGRATVRFRLGPVARRRLRAAHPRKLRLVFRIGTRTRRFDVRVTIRR